jgi:diguanylate cyclase (GGDEF)-like protein
MNERQLLEILVGFATTLTAEFSIQDVLDHLVTQVVDLLPVTGAGVLLMDGTADHHVISATDEALRRIEGLQVELGEGPCLTAYETGRYVAIPDLAADTTTPRFSAAAAAAGLGAVFSFPLRHAGIRLGALELYANSPVALSLEELGGGQTVADVVASYLLIARRRDQAIANAEVLSDAALHDHLTGLPNRRLLRDRLQQATDRSQRSAVPFGVLFCDVDDFKGANDHFGHQAGDELLVALAERLMASLRPPDTLARFAGDEFVIICEGMPDPDHVEMVARRTLDAIKEPFVLDDGSVVELHMSIGAALAGAGHAAADRALALADEAMYVAKAKGGARFVAAAGTSTPHPAEPAVPPWLASK